MQAGVTALPHRADRCRNVEGAGLLVDEGRARGPHAHRLRLVFVTARHEDVWTRGARDEQQHRCPMRAGSAYPLINGSSPDSGKVHRFFCKLARLGPSASVPSSDEGR